MGKLRNRAKQALSVVVAVCLAWATVVVPGAFAQGDSTGDSAAIALQAAEPAASDSPYTMEVTFDGEKLNSGGGNDLFSSSSWPSGTSKTASVTLTRNASVASDSNKDYVLCMRCSEVFYFAGLPDASKITGVDEVAIVENAAPKVNLSDGQAGQPLPGFSPYSGEIRLKLNAAVETVTVSGVGIGFNAAMTGYTGGAQIIRDPLGFSLVNVDSSEDLEDFANSGAQVLQSSAVSSVSVSTGRSGGSMKNTLSTKKFADGGVTEQNVNIGKDGTITYAGGTAGQNSQLFKSVVVEFDCPYISVEDRNYYLSFNNNDTALSDNKQGAKTAFKMSQNAVYDENSHTITYRFENIYLGGHTILFMSPVFSWPSDEALGSYSVSDPIQIQGATWRITEQKSYTEASTTLASSYGSTWHASYVKAGPNISLVSSDAAKNDLSQKIATRHLYNGLTRDSGIEGPLGFFDIHNKGASDSGDLKMEVEFNTDESSGAKYYVTRMNLPSYQSSSQVAVHYVLSNGAQEVGGDATGLKPDAKGTLVCLASTLRRLSGVGGDYYIKLLSYTTRLQAGTAYHYETAHLYRNRSADAGLFSGYIEGDPNAADCSASAKMTISSAGNEPIDEENNTSLETVERSFIDGDDYIAFAPQAIKFGSGEGSSSTSITAGDSARLSFSASISAEEYAMDGTVMVNGYHTFRDGIFYIALPKGVSISGSGQVAVAGASSSNPVVGEVKELEGSGFKQGNVEGSWWAVQVSGINTNGGQTISVSVQLATALDMQSVSWNFFNCVAIQAKNQRLSWGAAENRSTLFNSVEKMTNNGSASVGALGVALNRNTDLGLDMNKFGINVYGGNTSATLTIARAEAKLDVATSLHLEGDAQQGAASIKLSDVDKTIGYDVTVSSEDGGHAQDFSYYIPVPKTGSAIDAESFVASCDVPLSMTDAMEVADVKTGSQVAAEDSPFEVSYTTLAGLTADSVRGEGVEWTSSPGGWSEVTAVRVTTKQEATVTANASYRFSLRLKCDLDQASLEKKAGLAAQWRSFGRYTYVRNGVSTSNTYPSEPNTLAACCAKNCGSTDAVLNTGAASGSAGPTVSSIDISADAGLSFERAQTLRVKSVAVSTGTELLNDPPTDLSGSDANSKFKVSFNINNERSSAITVLDGKGGGSWSVDASGSIRLQAAVTFSKALTDATTERYVDLVIGNDCVDITWRVNLKRTVAPVAAEGSGVAAGACYQVPTVGDSCSIARNSAFTALFVAENFVPANYSGQSIGLESISSSDDVAAEAGDAEIAFPQGTAITMMPLDESSNVTGCWQHVAAVGESSVGLDAFTRVAGGSSAPFTCDTTSPSQTTLRYMLVVDFSGVDSAAQLSLQACSIVFRAAPKEGVESGEVRIAERVDLCDGASFELSASASGDAADGLSVSLQRGVVKSTGSESCLDDKSLSLVVAPQTDGDVLPADARLRTGGDGSSAQTYTRNSAGYFIIPIGTISPGTNTTDLTLESDMFPDAAKAYRFTARLMLSNSSEAEAPANGAEVASYSFTLSKPERECPAVKVTGTQVAASADWAAGQELDLTIGKIPSGASLTVSAHSGLEGNQQVTDLLSSVCGVFDIENGTGTYDPSKPGQMTRTLVLSGNAQPGTYRLLFEVKAQGGRTLLSVPYYLVVR